MSIFYLGPQPTPKPKLLKTDVAVGLASLISILAFFNVFINSKNSSAKIVYDIAARMFYLVLPPYWILRNIYYQRYVIKLALISSKLDI